MYFPKFDGYDTLATTQKDFLHALSDLLNRLDLALLDKEKTCAKLRVDQIDEKFLEIMVVNKDNDDDLGLWIRAEEFEVIVYYGPDHWHYGESYGFDENEWIPYAIQKIEEWLMNHFERSS